MNSYQFDLENLLDFRLFSHSNYFYFFVLKNQMIIFLSLLLSLEPLVLALTTDEHSDNWAVILSASNFWFNYRHEANALGIYNELKKNGFPDSHIVLMVSDNFEDNPRNN